MIVSFTLHPGPARRKLGVDRSSSNHRSPSTGVGGCASVGVVSSPHPASSASNADGNGEGSTGRSIRAPASGNHCLAICLARQGFPAAHRRAGPVRRPCPSHTVYSRDAFAS
eukprot:6923164-Prymnesium_polylepis.1